MNMTIIEIEPLANGAHNNQTVYEDNIPVPDGWAYMPESTKPWDRFPFGTIEVTDGESPDGSPCKVVTKWAPGKTPEPEPEPEPEPTELEKIQAQVLYTAVMTDTLIPEDEEE